MHQEYDPTQDITEADLQEMEFKLRQLVPTLGDTTNNVATEIAVLITYYGGGKVLLGFCQMYGCWTPLPNPNDIECPEHQAISRETHDLLRKLRSE